MVVFQHPGHDVEHPQNIHEYHAEDGVTAHLVQICESCLMHNGSDSDCGDPVMPFLKLRDLLLCVPLRSPGLRVQILQS